MKTNKLLKTPFTMYVDKFNLGRAISQAETSVGSVNRLIATAKENGFDLNDDEANQFINSDWRGVLKVCLERTETIKYQISPEYFSRQIAIVNNSRVNFSPLRHGCWTIKNQVAEISESWRKYNQEFHERNLTTENGLKKYQTMISVAEQINEVLAGLSEEFKISELFLLDDDGKVIPMPLPYDTL